MKRNSVLAGQREPRCPCTHLMMCATTAGPYQSPARFPEVLPSSTSLCMPSWAEGPSPNQDTTVRWYTSLRCVSASSAPPPWGWGTGSRATGLSPCSVASREATSLRAAVLVHVSESRGWRDRVSDHVQSGKGVRDGT